MESNTDAVNLLHRMLAAAKAGSLIRTRRRAFDAEAAALGREAMDAARRTIGDAREAVRMAASEGAR